MSCVLEVESRGLVLGNNCMDGVAIYLSQGYKVKVLAAQSCLTLCNPMDCSLCPWNSPGKNTSVGIHFLLLGSPPLRDQIWVSHIVQIFYHLTHQGSPNYCKRLNEFIFELNILESSF